MKKLNKQKNILKLQHIWSALLISQLHYHQQSEICTNSCLNEKKLKNLNATNFNKAD